MTKNNTFYHTNLKDFDWTMFLKSVKDGNSLDLSQKAITEIPNTFCELYSNLQYLYLEGNELTELNKKLFLALRKLKWLDVRNNKLTTIPTTIVEHPSLQVLLLEGNHIETLPTEIGSLEGLRGIQLACNPLVYPPSHVVSAGVESTIDFLRRQWQQCQSPENIQLISESHNQPSSAVNPQKPTRLGSAVKEVTSTHTVKTVKKSKSSRCKSSTRLKSTNPQSQGRKSQMSDANLNTCICVRPISNSVHKRPTGLSTMAVEGWPMMTDQVYENFQYNNGELNQHKTNKSNYKTQRKDCQDQVLPKQLRDIWIEKIRNMLIAQETILQRRRNQEAMQQWQDEAKAQENTHYKKDFDTAITFPYDTDPDYLKMRSRRDLTPTVAERRRDSSLHNIRHEEPINSKIISIMEALQSLQKTQNLGSASPRSEQRILSQEISKIKEIQRSLNALKLKNFGQMSLPL